MPVYITKFITSSISGKYSVNSYETVYFAKGVTVANDTSWGIGGSIPTTHDMNITVEGSVFAKTDAVWLTSDGRLADNNNFLKLGSHSTLIGETGVAIDGFGGGNEVSANGQILAKEFGITSTSGDSVINIGLTGQITASFAGIKLEGDNAIISNSGYIYGVNNGIYAVGGVGFSLTNAGEVGGGSGVRLTDVAGTVRILNDGNMTGQVLAGLYPEDTDASVVNTGSISGILEGVFLTGGGIHSVSLVNSGTISGTSYSIRTASTSFEVENSGTLNGDVEGEGGIDSLVNRGSILGSVALGGGNDSYRGIGSGTVSGYVDGETGDDALKGARFADDLRGGAGKDSLRGLAGDDALSGGAGSDLVKGGAGDDTLNGDDGNDKLRAGSGDDVLNGGGQKDKLYGGRGNDELNGGKGNDILDGGDDSDILTGGGGKDFFVFYDGNGRDTITDFENDVDTVVLQESIWGGGLTLTEVIADYAKVVRGDIVFDFGADNVLIVEDMSTTGLLSDDILLV